MSETLQIEEHRLYATDSSAGQLAWIGERLPDVAEADVIVISKSDIPVFSLSALERRDLINSGEFKSVFQKQLSDHFNRLGVPDAYVTAMMEPRVVAELAPALFKQSPGATGMDLDGDGVSDFGIVVAPDFEFTNADYISFLSGVPKDKLMNIPEGYQDGLATVMFHEAGHIVHPSTGSHTLFGEIGADHHSQEHYAEDVDVGLLNPQFFEAFLATRISGSLITSGGYLEGYQAMQAGDMVGFLQAQLPSHATHVGFSDHDAISPDDTINSLPSGTSLPGVMSLNFFARAFVGMVKVQEMRGENQDPDQPNLVGEAAHFFKSKLDLVTSLADPMKLADVGASYISENSILAYAAIKAMEEAGMFSGELFAAERQQMSDLDRFFENYVVDVKNDPEFVKYKQAVLEIVEQNDLAGLMKAAGGSPDQGTDLGEDHMRKRPGALLTPS